MKNLFRIGRITSKFHIFEILSYAKYSEEIITLLARTSSKSYRLCVQNIQIITRLCKELPTMTFEYIEVFQ